MVQSPSWAANWFAASQEIPRISQNPKVHYRTHKRPPPVSILGPPNPVHIPTSHLLEIHPNIIHPSTPRYPKWSPSLRFPHQDPIHSPLLTHTRHMPSPSHSSRFYHPHKYIYIYIYIRKLLVSAMWNIFAIQEYGFEISCRGYAITQGNGFQDKTWFSVNGPQTKVYRVSHPDRKLKIQRKREKIWNKSKTLWS